MRCKVKEPEPLYEFEPEGAAAVLLCEGHYRRAAEHQTNPAPVGPPAPAAAPPCAGGIDSEVENQYDLSLMPKATTAQPYEAPAIAATETAPEQTAVVVEHAPVYALVEPMREEYSGMASQLVGFAIATQGQVDMAGELLKQVKGKIKKLDAQRKEITRPMLEAKAAVDALFRPAIDAAKSVEGILKAELAAFVAAQQQAQVAALQAGNHEAALAVTQPEMPKGVSTRTVWKWRITNVDIIPREFWVIDAAKVQTHVNAHKGQSAIPGVEAYCETGIAASAS